MNSTAYGVQADNVGVWDVTLPLQLNNQAMSANYTKVMTVKDCGAQRK